jgi:ribose transport system permease protein
MKKKNDLSFSRHSVIAMGLKAIWSRLGIWLICILMFSLLSFSTDNFLTVGNLINVVRQVAVMGIVALGSTFVVLCGEIDLSQGGVVALIGCVCAKLIMEMDVYYIVAIIISLLLGCLIMTAIGVVITVFRVPSFIATLGLQYVLLGVVILMTNSQPITGLPSEFTVIARGYIGGVIPVAAIILFVIYLIGAFVLKYLAFGRNVMIVGENPTAAMLSGINVIFSKIAVFSIAGIMSAMGSVVLAARLASGQPSSGSDISLMALAAVFIGGANGGSVMNTMAGTFIIGLINNGLNLIGVNASWKNVALGSIIITAVALDMVRSKRVIGS